MMQTINEQKTNNLKDISPLFFRSGQPIPIENLRGEHTLDSRVRLVISYQVTGAFFKMRNTVYQIIQNKSQGRPTTTIAVGDPLEFKLETQEGENLLRDIFATNVVAKVTRSMITFYPTFLNFSN